MSDDPYRQQPAPYGQPTYGQPAPYGQAEPYGGRPSPTSTAATNSKAIVAICLGFAAPLVGLVFGVLALREIKRTGEGGKGFAITGVVLGALLLLVVLAYVGVIVAFVVSLASSGGQMSGDLFAP
ncbi:DUF4190 domain-containing protein [uncultured Pseudokineococcus sp.]|uniref:DUF4190 domain-containing protein n=1 Tax=uncultured Pseudokineococcus sp. TaxID=1642928 RepID=UPI0026132864|nr:DUF4190 domain-containing protein [uncultured Pseudokineococcus sp.]